MRLQRLHKSGAVAACMLCAASVAQAQYSQVRYGQRVPAAVRVMIERGLKHLAASQQPDGGWPGMHGSQQAGVAGLCIMSFMATGEDPNFGKYASNVRRALQNMIANQDPQTGYLGGSMYHHGFGMLGLSEAYGAVDGRRLWEGSEVPADRRRSVASALDLAVRCAVTAQQKNQWGGWRYSPTSTDADTSVSGAVLVGLLGARNAGMEIPDQVIDKALAYFRSSTSKSGSVSYASFSGHGSSLNRSAIATLVFAIGKREDWSEFKATSGYIIQSMDQPNSSYPFYNRYYMAQSLFQADIAAWERWNRKVLETLGKLQSEDGSFPSRHGAAYGTAMSVLALALNYKLLPIYER